VAGSRREFSRSSSISVKLPVENKPEPGVGSAVGISENNLGKKIFNDPRNLILNFRFTKIE